MVLLEFYYENSTKYVNIEEVAVFLEYKRVNSFINRIKKEPNESGLGLGLLLSYKIIHLMKGKIWVENRIKGNPSMGSNFIVLIPQA